MKVAVVGTHGSGKTTVVYSLSEKLAMLGLDVEVVEEVARECPYPLNENGTFRTQLWILFTQMLKEECSEADVLITDRSVLDHVAYSNVLMRRGKMSPAEFSFIFIVASLWCALKPYDRIFMLLPLEEGISDEDPVRSKDPEFQAEVHCALEQVFSSLGIESKVIRVESKNHSERVTTILRNLLGV